MLHVLSLMIQISFIALPRWIVKQKKKRDSYYLYVVEPYFHWKIDGACLTLFFSSSSVDSPINDDKVNEVKAEVSVLENNANDRKKNDIADVRENYKFDVSLSFI